MLTSITPLGERGRGNRWSVTAAWLVAGHLVGALALGAMVVGSAVVARALGVGIVAGQAGADTATTLIGAVALAAIAFDLAGGRIPGTRQVDERWLTTYRGWVYGFGFGVQLGFGLVTVVNTALLAAVVVAVAVLDPAVGLSVAVLYGAGRGVAAIGSGRVRSVGDLHRLHRRLDERELVMGRVTHAGVALSALAAVGTAVLA